MKERTVSQGHPALIAHPALLGAKDPYSPHVLLLLQTAMLYELYLKPELSNGGYIWHLGVKDPRVREASTYSPMVTMKPGVDLEGSNLWNFHSYSCWFTKRVGGLISFSTVRGFEQPMAHELMKHVWWVCDVRSIGRPVRGNSGSELAAGVQITRVTQEACLDNLQRPRCC